MTERLTTEQYRGYLIAICVDSDPENPRKGQDNLGRMICFHRRYTLGDEHSYSSPQDYVMELTGKGEEDLGRHPNDDLGDGSEYRIVWEPLYLYDHSGITMRTTPFSCPWDSGQVGIIYITYDDIAKDLGVVWTGEGKWVPSKEIIEQYTNRLKAEIEEYNAYISGDVVGFQIFGPNLDRTPEDGLTEADDDFWNEDDEDSCWGFYSQALALEMAKGVVDGLCESENNA